MNLHNQNLHSLNLHSLNSNNQNKSNRLADSPAGTAFPIEDAVQMASDFFAILQANGRFSVETREAARILSAARQGEINTKLKA